jgi:hypothetical protein
MWRETVQFKNVLWHCLLDVINSDYLIWYESLAMLVKPNEPVKFHVTNEIQLYWNAENNISGTPEWKLRVFLPKMLCRQSQMPYLADLHVSKTFPHQIWVECIQLLIRLLNTKLMMADWQSMVTIYAPGQLVFWIQWMVVSLRKLLFPIIRLYFIFYAFKKWLF